MWQRFNLYCVFVNKNILLAKGVPCFVQSFDLFGWTLDFGLFVGCVVSFLTVMIMGAWGLLNSKRVVCWSDDSMLTGYFFFYYFLDNLLLVLLVFLSPLWWSICLLVSFDFLTIIILLFLNSSNYFFLLLLMKLGSQVLLFYQYLLKQTLFLFFNCPNIVIIYVPTLDLLLIQLLYELEHVIFHNNKFIFGVF